MIKVDKIKKKKYVNLEIFKFKIHDEDFEIKLIQVLEKFNKTELVQITNFLKFDIKETEKETAYNILSVLTDLANFSSRIESYSDTENPELCQNTQQTDENSLNRTSNQNESEFSSAARLKENVSIKNLKSINGSKIISNNLKENEGTIQNWEKSEKIFMRGILRLLNSIMKQVCNERHGFYILKDAVSIIIKIMSGKYRMHKNI